MYENLLEKNKVFIENRKTYRKYSNTLNSLVTSLNKKKIVTLTGLRYTGKTDLIHQLLKKTESFESSFYYNSDLDTLGSIQSHDDFITLFDLYVRIHGVPKIIILQNTNNVTGIKALISQLYNTKKYKIIIVGNNIKIDGAAEIELYPLSMDNNTDISNYGGIPQVRIVPDAQYKSFLLDALKQDIISRDILESYNIKNISLFYRVIGYIALNPGYYSLREIHRDLETHGIKVSLITMIEYINACINTKLLSKCERYDIKNNNTISSKAQYFFGDVGLRKSFTSSSVDLRENLIYLELLIKGYSVTGGINGRFSFEFFAKKEGHSDIAIAIDHSQDKVEIRKAARKLAKLGADSQKFVIVQNKNSLTMRKFIESGVRIIEIGELVKVI